MKRVAGVVFEPETVKLLYSVLDDAWASLQPVQQLSTNRTDLAERIVTAAALGERDPIRLRARALLSMVPRAG